MKMKNFRKIMSLGFIAVVFLSACNNSKTADTSATASTPGAADGEMDRSILPVKEPIRQTYTELDSRNAKAPPRFHVQAPKDAPNVVVVLIDDIGFGASKAFGGAI